MNLSSSQASLHILQWNCRGARDKLTELQRIAVDCQIICLQETLLSAQSNISISGFNCIRSDVMNPGLRGLCFFVKNTYSFSVIDLMGLSHPTVEVLGISVNCSLDFKKYALVMGDFNAHHQAWNSTRQDRMGEYIYRNFEAANVVVLNDGSSTHIAPPGFSDSIIDLTFATRELAILCETITESDSRGSDHFPIKILIGEVAPSSGRFCYKYNLNKKQLVALHCILDHESTRFEEELSSPQSTLDPITKYNTFVTLLKESIELIVPKRPSGSTRRRNLAGLSTPAPWWNKKCSEAVEARRNLCRIYKASPTLDNWTEFRRETARCRRVLKREKRLGWKNLCSSFSFKTPTPAIWKFIRSYKKKSLARGHPSLDDSVKAESQDLIINKLCPPFCFCFPSQSFEEMKTTEPNYVTIFIFGWMILFRSAN